MASETTRNPNTPETLAIPAAFGRARRRSNVLSLTVTALVVPGLFATVALPAYAYQPATDGAPQTAELQRITQQNVQSFAVASSATPVVAARDAFTATTPEQLAAAAAQVASASSVLANPPYPSFSLDAVVQVAMQYQGVPYVFGGSTPSGFDCSGFVMYVYAQFGIDLPHGVSSAAAVGTEIAWEAALPGDVVVMPGHSGIYLGNGMMIDAPYEGRVVSVNEIWSDSAYIVRYGI